MNVHKNGPFWEALRLLCGGSEPPEFTKGIYSCPVDDAEVMELQDWCATNCKPDWATGIGTIEAAEHMVNVAVENGNIPPGNKSRSRRRLTK